MRITLVNGWRTWWRQYSTWLAGAGAAVVQFAPELAEGMQYAWNFTPADIRASFDPETVQDFGTVLIVLSIFAKYIRQRKLAAEARRDAIAEAIKGGDDRLGPEGKPDLP